MTWYLDEAEAGVKLECEILTVKMRQKRNKRFVNYVVSCNYDIWENIQIGCSPVNEMNWNSLVFVVHV